MPKDLELCIQRGHRNKKMKLQMNYSRDIDKRTGSVFLSGPNNSPAYGIEDLILSFNAYSFDFDLFGKHEKYLSAFKLCI